MAPGLYATLTAACKETENRICHPPSTAFCWIRVGTAPRYPFYIPHPFQHSMDTQRHPDPSSGSSKSTQNQQLFLLKKETNQPTHPWAQQSCRASERLGQRNRMGSPEGEWQGSAPCQHCHLQATALGVHWHRPLRLHAVLCRQQRAVG